MNKPKMIILADIASLRISCVGFKQLVNTISEKFEIATCKFYSYVAKRNRDFNEYIASNAFDTELPSASRRRNKLDSRQIIDCTQIASLGKIDAVGLVSGEGDTLPIINLLKSKGIEVYEIDVVETKYSYAYTGFIKVPQSALKIGYTAPATKVAKKAAKPVIAKPAVAQKETTHLDEVKKILDGASILAQYKNR